MKTRKMLRAGSYLVMTVNASLLLFSFAGHVIGAPPPRRSLG